MNKTEALARLQALENETAALRKIIEAPEDAPSLLNKATKWDQEYWQINSDFSGGLSVRKNNGDGHVTGGNCFTTQKQAQAYADAIETMLLLRHQPGTIPPQKGRFTIAMSHRMESVLVEDGWTERVKTMFICPFFETEEHAASALAAVGADRILRMFKTFHHIE